jgi:hypothetical protein
MSATPRTTEAGPTGADHAAPTRPPAGPREQRRARTLALVLLGAGVFAGCDELLNAVGDGGVDGLPMQNRDGGMMSGPGCGLANEPEPNDNRNLATPYTPGNSVTGCIGSMDDVDFYETTVPIGDQAGGYYEAQIADVGDGTIDVKVFTASDNAPLLRAFTSSPGASLFFYWAGAPGATYRIAVTRLNPLTSAFRYNLRASYRKVNDTYEPNDTRDSAKPITIGTPVSAFLFTGHRAEAVDSAEFNDWYSFTLAAGTVTIKVTDVPGNVRPDVMLYDSENTMVQAAHMSNPTSGGGINVTTTVTKPGPHRLVLGTFPPAPDTAGKSMTPPDSFVKPYTLTVSQP